MPVASNSLLLSSDANGTATYSDLYEVCRHSWKSKPSLSTLPAPIFLTVSPYFSLTLEGSSPPSEYPSDESIVSVYACLYGAGILSS